MFSIRDYTSGDAQKIISWLTDEKSFRKWSADKYKCFPPKESEIDAFYESIKADGGNAYMFLDNNIEIGHFVLRPLPQEKIETVRIGFIILDSTIRGKGYGRRMLDEAIRFAISKYDVNRITLGVFENNPRARKCYEAVGFTQWGETVASINGEEWKCLEMEYIKK